LFVCYLLTPQAKQKQSTKNKDHYQLIYSYLHDEQDKLRQPDKINDKNDKKENGRASVNIIISATL